MARPMAVGLHSKPLSPAQLGNPKNDMRVTNNSLSVTLRVPRAGFENYSGILIFTAFYCTTDLQYTLIINNIDIIAPVIRAPIRD